MVVVMVVVLVMMEVMMVMSKTVQGDSASTQHSTMTMHHPALPGQPIVLMKLS